MRYSRPCEDRAVGQQGSSAESESEPRTQSRRLTWMTISLTALSTNLIWFVCAHERDQGSATGGHSVAQRRLKLTSVAQVKCV